MLVAISAIRNGLGKNVSCISPLGRTEEMRYSLAGSTPCWHSSLTAASPVTAQTAPKSAVWSIKSKRMWVASLKVFSSVFFGFATKSVFPAKNVRFVKEIVMGTHLRIAEHVKKKPGSC